MIRSYWPADDDDGVPQFRALVAVAEDHNCHIAGIMQWVQRTRLMSIYLQRTSLMTISISLFFTRRKSKCTLTIHDYSKMLDGLTLKVTLHGGVTLTKTITTHFDIPIPLFSYRYTINALYVKILDIQIK